MAKGKWNEDYLAKRIKQERDTRKWTQKELGERLGVDVTVIAKIEKNTRAVRAGEAAVLADLFDTTVDNLLGRKAQPADEAAYALATALDTARKSGLQLSGIQNEIGERFAELDRLEIDGLGDLKAVADTVDKAMRIAADGLARIAYYRQVGRVPFGNLREAYSELYNDAVMAHAKGDKE